MSKVLVFQDGTSAEFTDESIITDLVTVVSEYGEVDDLRAKFTVDNLVGCEFDGELIEYLIPVSSNAAANVDENITVHFINRFKTSEEIMMEQITELQEAVAEIGG